ncbi:cobyric acid synthase [Nitrospira sp. Nam74]
MAARTLMIQGTASHVGKSVLTSALCRVFQRRGLRVAPFKAQNMSNNSFVTPDGKEIGRAQAVQAAACRLTPRTDFNPILIKPSGDCQAQLVVHGEVAGSLTPSSFGRLRREHFATVCEAFARLSAEFDLVILEGAGSPAEINLHEQDIVNMRMAQVAHAPVLLTADIERGGVFAALVGTHLLLRKEERPYVKGFIINKFRGDPSLLTRGITDVEARLTVRCLGIVPYWNDMYVPEEDSVGSPALFGDGKRLRPGGVRATGCDEDGAPERLAIGVVDLPHLSNSTDLEALARTPDVHLIRVVDASTHPLDALIIPGTKHTAEALHFVRDRGIDHLVKRVVDDGGTVMGLCGGFQLLGRLILDPDRVESTQPALKGLGLLDVVTTFEREKRTRQVCGIHVQTGCSVEGYEVHMGQTVIGRDMSPFLEIRTKGETASRKDGAVSHHGGVIGTYVHGVFDAPDFRRVFLNQLRQRRGWAPLPLTEELSLDRRLDTLADFVENHLDLVAIERIIEQGV